MITNPYKILGVPDGASEEECTKAYKKLAKKYHPDLNPNDKEAERKMAEINAAYDQIKSGNASANQGAYSHASTTGQAPDYLSSVAQFIQTGQYQQAINLLNSIDDRNARWYYLSALAYMSLGNQVVALDHIREAYAKEPENEVYTQAYYDIKNGVNPLNKDIFSTIFDFTDFGSGAGYSQQQEQGYRRTYTSRSNGSCIGRIIRIIIIIVLIRLAIRFVSFAFYSLTPRHQPETSQKYGQQYDQKNNQNDGEYYFGDDGVDEYKQ